MIPREVIDEIKNRVDIVEVVSEYVNLAKVGSYYRALCPFHTETTPSFYVHPGLKIYHCFGCGASGDVIKFVQEMEGLSFQEALEKLAKRAGVDLSVHKSSRPSEYGRYVEYHNLVWKEYVKNVERFQEAKRYLVDRGFTEEEIKEFGFGYAPLGSKTALEVAEKMGLSEEELTEFGLLVKKGNEFVDRFEGRLIIPVKNDSGHVVAFGGRLLGEGEPKYLNSPDTKYFSKRKVMFLFYDAKKWAKEVGFFVLTEGYFDAIAFRRAGVPTSVAVLGTNLSREAILKLSAYSKNVILCFDNDAAGVRATLKTLEDLLEHEFNVLVASVAPYKDPDELLQKEGREALKSRLKDSRPFEIFLVDRARDLFDLKVSSGVRNYLLFLKKWAQKMREKGYLKNFENMVREASRVLSTTESDVLNFFSSEKSKEVLVKREVKKIFDVGEALAFLFINYEHFRERILSLDLSVLDGEAKNFFDFVSKDKTVDEVMVEAPKNLRDWIFSVLERIPPPKDVEKFFNDVLHRLDMLRTEKRIKEIEKMMESATEEEKRVLMQVRMDLLRKVRGR